MAEILYELNFEYEYGDEIDTKIEEARILLKNNLTSNQEIAKYPFILKKEYYKNSEELNHLLTRG